MMSFLKIAALIFFKIFLIHLFIDPFKGTPWAQHLYVDIWSWLGFLRDSNAGKIPYVEFTKEYPVGIGSFFWALSFIIDGSDRNLLLNFFIIFFTLIDVFNCVLFYKISQFSGVRRAGIYCLLYLLLPSNLILTSFRYESLVNLFLFGGYYLYLQKQKNVSTILYALGSTLKWYPAILFFVSAWKDFLASHSWKQMFGQLSIFAFVFLGVNSIFVALGLLHTSSISAWSSTYLFHAVERPLYWDTPLGALSLWFGAMPAQQYASLFSLLLMAVFFFWRPKLDPLTKTAVIIAAALICNRVYSTQFHLWFLPLVILCSTAHPRQRVLLCLVFVLDVVNVAIYPFLMTETIIELGGFAQKIAVVRGDVWTEIFTALVLLRPFLLIALIALLLRLKKS